jgi:hypothetical protein
LTAFGAKGIIQCDRTRGGFTGCVSIKNVKLSSEGDDNLIGNPKRIAPSKKKYLKGGIFE